MIPMYRSVAVCILDSMGKTVPGMYAVWLSASIKRARWAIGSPVPIELLPPYSALVDILDRLAFIEHHIADELTQGVTHDAIEG